MSQLKIAGGHLLRLRAIALALRVLRLRAIALALRVLRLRAIALALRVLRLRAIALALRVLRLRAIALALRVLRLRAIALALRGSRSQFLHHQVRIVAVCVIIREFPNQSETVLVVEPDRIAVAGINLHIIEFDSVVAQDIFRAFQ